MNSKKCKFVKYDYAENYILYSYIIIFMYIFKLQYKNITISFVPIFIFNNY